MEAILKAYRAYLQTLIENEQRRLGYSVREMLRFMQSSSALPDWYRIPAQESAADLFADSASPQPDNEFSDAVKDAIKAVYGAWIREQYRTN